MIAGFDIAVHRCGVTAVVAVGGELDLATAPCLRDQLAGLADSGALEVTVDLAQLDFIDSTGLHVLVSALKRFRSHGGDLTLRAATPRTMKVFALTGLASVFRFAGEVDQPVPALSEGATA